ncbi:MAG: hypothetical protein AB7O47_03970 [Flavobacteriales bacterium]
MNDLQNKNEEPHFTRKIAATKNRFSLIYKNILEGLKTETIETKQASKIALKYISKGSITKEEEVELRQQVYDILKTLGVGIPFALIPGASILIPILVKVAQKKGINLLPSAFSETDDSLSNDSSK